MDEEEKGTLANYVMVNIIMLCEKFFEWRGYILLETMKCVFALILQRRY